MEKHICVICEYVYDPELGDPTQNIPAGTKFEDTRRWVCPDCEAGKKNLN